MIRRNHLGTVIVGLFVASGCVVTTTNADTDGTSDTSTTGNNDETTTSATDTTETSTDTGTDTSGTTTGDGDACASTAECDDGEYCVAPYNGSAPAAGDFECVTECVPDNLPGNNDPARAVWCIDDEACCTAGATCDSMGYCVAPAGDGDGDGTGGDGDGTGGDGDGDGGGDGDGDGGGDGDGDGDGDGG